MTKEQKEAKTQCELLSILKTKAQTNFKFGPIQTAWIVAMEAYPERQIKNKLGKRINRQKYQSCALGELHVQACRLNNKMSAAFKQHSIFDGTSGSLGISYLKYGLKTPAGHFSTTIKIKGSSYGSIVDMNDEGITYPEIAAIIRKYPKKIFTKSV